MRYPLFFSRLTAIFLLWINLGACNQGQNTHSPKYDEQSKWLLTNESKLNSQLNVFIIKQIKDTAVEHKNWTSIGTVFTKDDTVSMMGKFAGQVSLFSDCLLVCYTYKRDTSQRKIITIYKSEKDSLCKVNLDSLLTFLDSTKYFKIEKRENFYE